MSIKAKFISFVLMVSILLFQFQFVQPAFAATFNHGPYLVDMKEDSVIIVWFTDVNASGKVEYGTGGSFNNSKTEVANGLVTIGKRHEVRLTGLSPGTTYNYRVVSTPVTSWSPNYPVLGTKITSSSFNFTTFDDTKTDFTFYYITDTHDDPGAIDTLLGMVDWNNADFVMHAGDAFNYLDSESQLFTNFLDPLVTNTSSAKPIVFSKGNHDMRGQFSRNLYHYFPNTSGEFYHGFTHGPASFANVDGGEDKADNAPAFGGLTASEEYVNNEFIWYQNYTNSSSFQNSPFKIVFTHKRYFQAASASGYNYMADWYDASNDAGVHLVLSGHNHVLAHYYPGYAGNDFHNMVLGQNQLAKVRVTTNNIYVTVFDNTAKIVDSFVIPQNLANDDTSAENVVLNGTVTVSSDLNTADWSKNYVVNDSISSAAGDMGWTSNNSLTTNHTEWISVDLGENNSISRVDLYPRNDSGNVGQGFPVDFTIQTSTDNVNWTTVVTKTGYSQPGNSPQGFGFAATTARYIKVTGTSLRPNPNESNKYRMQFAEIRAFGGNMAAGGPAASTSSYEHKIGWGAAAATDGIRSSVTSTSLGWTSSSSLTANHTESITVDLEGSSRISKVDLYPRNDTGQIGAGFPVNFTIKVSNDNTNWTTVVTQTNYAQPGNAVQSFSFAAQSAVRYVKIEGTSLRPNPNDGNTYRMQFAEIEVY